MNVPLAAVARSRDEVLDTIRLFTIAEWARLRLTAKKYAYCHTMSHEDLLHEAILRAIEENDARKCPSNVDVVKFLAETMRSISNGEYKKIHKVAPVTIANHGNQSDDQIDPPDSALNPEEVLMVKQDEAAILSAALAPFEDDQAARDIVEGTLAGMNGQELRELIGLDQTAYDSKRKLVRRRIDNTYNKDGSHDIKK